MRKCPYEPFCWLTHHLGVKVAEIFVYASLLFVLRSRELTLDKATGALAYVVFRRFEPSDLIEDFHLIHFQNGAS